MTGPPRLRKYETGTGLAVFLLIANKKASLKCKENKYLQSRVARRIINANICVAVFHFPRLLTATTC